MRQIHDRKWQNQRLETMLLDAREYLLIINYKSSSIFDPYQGRSQDTKRVATVATTVAFQQVRDRLSLRG